MNISNILSRLASVTEITADIIVVSRTKMGGENICVGAFDVTNKRNIRLLTSEGANQTSDFSLNIGETFKVVYSNKTSGITSPHTEDVLLKSYNPIPSAPVLAEFKENCQPINGIITNTFNGLLSKQNGNALSIGMAGIPDHSVCYWRTDAPLTLNTSFSNIKYDYTSGIFRASIKFVGMQDPILTIPNGTVVRLSLARWWSPPEETEKRCYLQLSGWYI